MTRAVVVFHGDGKHWLSSVLMTGFHHVFVVLDVNGAWLRLDWSLGSPQTEILGASDTDLVTYYHAAGFAALETVTRETPARTPLILNNCVGFAKQWLGLSAPFVVTPFQLFKHLTKGARS